MSEPTVPEGFRARLLARLTHVPLYHGWDRQLEDPATLGLWLLTPARHDAADVNSLCLVADADQVTVQRVETPFDHPADPFEVWGLSRTIGVTHDEVVATGVGADTVATYAEDAPDLRHLPTQILLRVPRLRDALTTAGFDSAIAWAAISNYEVPFVAVWEKPPLLVGGPE